MSARHLRFSFASAIVLFAASACTSATGPSATADIEAVEITPLADEEHQGSDSIRATDATPMHDEHQGSDS